jgi:Linalool dehydratase/isomerase
MTMQQSIDVMANEESKPKSLALPELKAPLGPVTRRVQTRALVIYLLVAAFGVGLAFLGESPRLQAFGLGIIIPGGGLVYTGQWITLILVAVFFAVSFLIWFASGNIIGPPLVWLGSAAYAAYHAGHPHMAANYELALWLVPVSVGAGLVYLLWSRQKAFKEGLAVRAARNQYLAQETFKPVEEPSFDESFWRELTLEELKEARFVFDRALQPLDRYDGFDWVEFQFQFAAVRYQLNSINYGLALMQYHSTPSFHGYLKQAQRNTIDKMLDKRVWGFWRWESLWGNFTTDFDPIKKDNIMVSGWTGMAMGLYASVTGDDHYSKPGSMTFSYDDKSFEYDIHTMAECVYKNFKASEWTLFPCEPNWVYNMCNETGITFLAQHDRLYGTHYYADVSEDYLDTIDNEFTTVDGRVIALRSQRMGFSIPLLTSPLADASFGMWGNATKPLHSQRVWSIFRKEFVDVDATGHVDIKTKGWDEIDAGSYKPSLITTYGACRGFSLEMGDTELAENIKQTARKEYNYTERNGINYFACVSSMANIMNVYSAMMRHNAWAQLNQFNLPERILNGPLLSECEYPDVLVAKAVSHTGKDLELVLYPGSDCKHQQITLSRLEPNSLYRVSYPDLGDEAEFTSQANGELQLSINLDGRTVITIIPALSL